METSFKNKGEKKTFSDKRKLRSCCQEMYTVGNVRGSQFFRPQGDNARGQGERSGWLKNRGNAE